MKRKIFLSGCVFILLFSFIIKNVSAQGRLGYLAGTGIIFYNGDISPKATTIIPSSKIINPFFRIGINYRLSERLEASAILLHGNIEGADSLTDEFDNLLRNQSFKSSIDEFSVLLECKLFRTYKMRRINPYVFAGYGYFHFNPKAELNGASYELQPLGTEGQYITNGGYEKPYKLFQQVIPVGFGISLLLNPHWRLRLDYSIHFTFTDYLDDVSTVYPDSALLSSTPNGFLAIQFSNRRQDGKYPKTNRPRGNPDLNDSYTHIGITIIYNPGMFLQDTGYGNSNYKGKYKKLLKRKKRCPAY